MGFNILTAYKVYYVNFRKIQLLIVTMKRIELFKVALEHCENLSQKFPDLEITSSIRKQLKYLISYENTDDIDKSKWLCCINT